MSSSEDKQWTCKGKLLNGWQLKKWHLVGSQLHHKPVKKYYTHPTVEYDFVITFHLFSSFFSPVPFLSISRRIVFSCFIYIHFFLPTFPFYLSSYCSQLFSLFLSVRQKVRGEIHEHPRMPESPEARMSEWCHKRINDRNRQKTDMLAAMK